MAEPQQRQGATPEDARAAAERRKRRWYANIENAKERAAGLPRELTISLGFGTANLMLTQLMRGELAPSTAKEAAEVARIARGLAVDEATSATGDLPADEQRVERDDRVQRVRAMREEVRARAEQIAKEAPEGEDTVDVWADEWDLPDEDQPVSVEPRLRSVPDTG